MDQVPISMDDYGAVPATPVLHSLTLIRSCDLFIGIYGFRYGTLALGDAENRSITELEYEEARRLGIRRLCYLLGGQPPSNPSEPPEAQERLRAFKARIERLLVRGEFLTCSDLLGLIAGDLGRLSAGNPVGFDPLDIQAKLSAHAQRRASAVHEGELEGRHPVVPSPTAEAWERFVGREPWSKRQADALNELAELGERTAELRTLARHARRVNCGAPYLEVMAQLRELTADREIDAAIERLELRERRNRTPKDRSIVEQVRVRLSRLRAISKEPEYQRCFLVTGSLGSGKTHFMWSVLASSERSRTLILPMGSPRKNVQVAASVLTTAREALGQRPRGHNGIRSLAELDRLLPDYNLVIAFDDLEAWIQLDPGFFDRLKAAIEQHSHLTSILWLLLVSHRELDLLAGRSEFFDAWSFLGSRRQDWHGARRRNQANILPNVGGWIDLDVLDEQAAVGIDIVRHPQQRTLPAKSVDDLLVHDPSLRQSLILPFVAWTFVDHWRATGDAAVGHQFVDFVRIFWQRRRGALLRDLARDRIDNPEVLLRNLVTAVAEWMLRHGDKVPRWEDLFRGLLADADLSIHGKHVLKRGLQVLENAALLHVDELHGDARATRYVRLGLPLFWQFYTAALVLAGIDATSGTAEQLLIAIEAELRPLERPETREGVFSFILLLLEGRTEREISGALAADVWRRASQHQGLPNGSVWFAGAQAGRDTQHIVWTSAWEIAPVEDCRTVFSFMYFASHANLSTIEPHSRLAILNRWMPAIVGARLGDYFRYVAEVQIEACRTEKGLLRCMQQLGWCDRTGAASPLGSLCARRLIALAHQAPERVVERLIQFCSKYPAAPVDSSNPGEKPGWKERRYFGEFVLRTALEWLTEQLGVEACNLLRSQRWYQQRAIGCSPPVAIWMEREANVALGQVYRGHGGRYEARYIELVNALSRSRAVEDIHLAFHLIRHSVLTHDQRDATPGEVFHDILASLVLNPRFSEGAIKAWSAMLRRCFPHFDALLVERARRAQARSIRNETVPHAQPKWDLAPNAATRWPKRRRRP